MFYCEDCDKHEPVAEGTGQEYCPECGQEMLPGCEPIGDHGAVEKPEQGPEVTCKHLSLTAPMSVLRRLGVTA